MIDVIDHREVIEDWREAGSLTDSAQSELQTELQTEKYHTTILKPTEEASEEENEEEEAITTMCGNIEDKEELIRCKLIACWKDNQYCY